MPDGALYWYGYENTTLTGGNNFAGWTSNYSGVGVGNGSALTNYYECGTTSGQMHGFGTINKVNITNYSKIKTNVNWSSTTSYKFLQANPDKKTTSVLDGTSISPQPIMKIYNTGLAELDISSYSGNYGIAAYTYHATDMQIYALWLE